MQPLRGGIVIGKLSVSRELTVFYLSMPANLQSLLVCFQYLNIQIIEFCYLYEPLFNVLGYSHQQLLTMVTCLVQYLRKLKIINRENNY